MKKSDLFLYVAIFIGVLGFIDGMVLVKGISLMITVWVCTAALTFIFLGISFILQYLENLGANTNKRTK